VLHLPSLRFLVLLLVLMASTSCWRRSTSPAPSCPPDLPAVTIDPPATAVDCRVVLGPPVDLTTLSGLSRCRKPDGAPMADGDPCWTSAQASAAGAALADLILEDARLRACLDAAAGATP
jgi:hypothetical protein